MSTTTLSRADIPFTPALWGNDVDNDCAVVALINSARAAIWVQRRCDLAIDPDKVLAFFRATEGFTGADLSKAPAEWPQQVINYAIAHGVDVGECAPLVLRSAPSINPADRAAAANAISSSGSAYVTLHLFPGDWGEAEACDHQVFFWECDGTADTDLVTAGTWGAWRTEPWSWFTARISAAWALDWVVP